MVSPIFHAGVVCGRHQIRGNARGPTVQSARIIKEDLKYHCVFTSATCRDAEATRRVVVLEASAQQLVQRPEFDSRGLMVVGLHISSFDLVLQWLGKKGLRLLALTIPNPQGGRQMEYEMRKATGMNILIPSVATLRQAVRHLQQGGVVLQRQHH